MVLATSNIFLEISSNQKPVFRMPRSGQCRFGQVGDIRTRFVLSKFLERRNGSWVPKVR